MGSTDELDKRLRDLGLANTAIDIRLDATITLRTFAAMAGTMVAPSSGVAPQELLPHVSVRGDLELGRTLGEGGMGRVHIARQKSLGRDVAVKTLKEGATPEMANGLLEEARLTGSLEHPGVIPVHALELDEKARPMLVMKRIEGVEWSTLISDPNHAHWKGRSADERLDANVEILIQVCRTLELAHSRGILHLDLKPENVMVGDYGEVYLADWGVALRMDLEASSERAIVGTPLYMAPEMVRGSRLDARTDVYLLGATLHEVLTTKPRHAGDTLRTVLTNALRSNPVDYPDSVPAALAELCNRATSADPAERPQTAIAFREALGAHLRYRSANALARAASERVDALEKMLNDAGTDPPSDLAAAHRLATEARFGFAESLKQHAEHARARQGAERSLTQLVELELRQGHADTARALVSDLHEPTPELLRRIEIAEAELAEKRKGEKRLHALEHDLDQGLSGGARVLGLALVGLLLIILSSWSMRDITRITSRNLFGLSLISLVVIGVGIFVLRRRFFVNAFNRNLAILLFLSVVAITANRGVSFAFGEPIATMLSCDLAIICGMATVSAVTILRFFWGAAFLAFAGMILIRAAPAYAPYIYISTVLAIVTVVAIAFSRTKTKRVT